ncbi:MAG: response regulator [Bacteroidetes bacterium]|nr:response regulator [Bacteroidota bacterium]
MQKKSYENTLEDIFIVDSEHIHENKIIQQCFDVVGVFVIAINLKGNITFANNTAAELLEYSKKEIIGLSFIKSFIIESKQKQTKELFESVINGKSFYKEETRYYIEGKKKQQRIIESKNVTIRDKSNNILGILISGRDITDYVFKQKDLQTDLSLYRLLANNIPDINLFIFDKNLQFILAEGNEMKNNDLSRHDFEQNTLYEFPDKELREIWIPLFESALNGKESSTEYQYNNYQYNIWVLPVYTKKRKIFTGVAITQNITEDKQIKRKLRKSKEEAERANQSKTDFLARVSHEIRTPLNAILGFAEQLKQTELNNSQQEYVNIINKSSEHLLSLINDILVLSKIEAGQIRFDKSPFKLTYTIEYLYKAMLVKAQEKQIDFTYHIDQSLDQVLLGDQFRLRQILINMLSNAIKFTNSGSVKLNCFLDEEKNDSVRVKFEVADTGIGIHPKNLKEIFKRFKQADPSITKTYGGTGLGLAICKNLIELQAGTLSVSSEESVGTTFTFAIPYKKGHRQDMVPEDIGNIDSNALRDIKVLLVDDDNFNRILAKTILEKFGCVVTIAVNGSEAIRFIDKQGFDIILLDIHMSEVSGLDVAEFIRKKKQDQKTKILAVTAAVLKDDINRYFRVGINDFLIKPFKEIDLFNKMCEVLNLRDKNTKNEVEHTILRENANADLYDLSELLRMADGNQRFVNDMLVTFIENTENTVHLFKQFLKEKNWKQIGETAHKIIPAYKHLQVNSVVKMLIELKEITLEKRDYKRVPDLTKGTITNMQELLKDLKNEIN